MNLKFLLLLIAGHFVTDINTGALPALLPFIKESLNLTYTMTALVILIFNVTSSVIQPCLDTSPTAGPSDGFSPWAPSSPPSGWVSPESLPHTSGSCFL